MKNSGRTLANELRRRASAYDSRLASACPSYVAHEGFHRPNLRRLGVTSKLLQNYERGTNRISASKLYEIALSLDVPSSISLTIWVRRRSPSEMIRTPR